MEIVKIGNVIKDYTSKPFNNQISLIIIDSQNPYYHRALSNNHFIESYKIMKSKDILNVEISNVDEEIIINNSISTQTMMGKMKMQNREKIIDVIDDIIITNSNLYLIIDKGYFRDKAFKNLGI